MSKRHKKNKGAQPLAQSAEAAPVEDNLISVDELGGEASPSEEQPSAEFSPENGENDTAAIQEPEAAPEADNERDPEVGVEHGPEVAPAPTPAVLPELPPKQEEPKPAPAPKPTMVEVTHVIIPSRQSATTSVPSVQVKGSVRFTKPVTVRKTNQMVRRSVVTTNKNIIKKVDDLRNHSVIGIKVITMFNEYEEMRRSLDLANPVYRNKCARKLYDIMTICCPHRNGANAQSMSELANIVFNRFCNGLGTLYTDKSLLAGDYNLPTPSEAIKFDAFYGAMYQLAECAKYGTRITFNVKSLETLLQSTGASSAIKNIKAKLDAKMAQRAQEAKLGK